MTPGLAPGEDLASQVLSLLRERSETLATAESLTGGLVAGALTDVPGSSDVVVGGVVSYATGVKIATLGVPAGIVAQHGVVSQECAEAMASGVRTLLGADWGIATTGVAGPGPSEDIPAGTVHVAVAGPGEDGESRSAHRALHLDGSRREIRESTVEAVLDLLLTTVGEGLSGPLGTVGDIDEGRRGEGG